MSTTPQLRWEDACCPCCGEDTYVCAATDLCAACMMASSDEHAAEQFCHAVEAQNPSTPEQDAVFADELALADRALRGSRVSATLRDLRGGMFALVVHHGAVGSEAAHRLTLTQAAQLSVSLGAEVRRKARDVPA